MVTRAYLDTNLYVSYLLNSTNQSPPSVIIDAGLAGAFTILFGAPTLQEILDKVTNKSYLASRIFPDDLDELLSLLDIAGERITNAPDVVPVVSRDRKDDYLITYSMFGHADYLVSGDRDLLVLEKIEDLHIVSPSAFVEILDL